MKKISRALKIAGFSLLPTLLFVFLLECGLRVIFFKVPEREAFAVIVAVKRIKAKMAQNRASNVYDSLKYNELNIASTHLYAPVGAEIRKQLLEIFTSEVEKLKEATKRIDAKLVLLYIPSDKYQEHNRLGPARTFFRSLSKKTDISLIDTTEYFLKFPQEYTTLLPENGHLSRLGNQLVAKTLKEALSPYLSHRSSFRRLEAPTIRGHLSENKVDFWSLDFFPYLVNINKQGFRAKQEYTFPKPKPRIVVLGDSFTFGPFLNIEHTYPYLLERDLKDFEVINAGVSSYTVTDEVNLFTSEAIKLDPDIVILQVLDNDIFGLLSTMTNIYERNGVRTITDYEQKFIDDVRKAGLWPTDK